jgi:hypothetical protein
MQDRQNGQAMLAQIGDFKTELLTDFSQPEQRGGV